MSAAPARRGESQSAGFTADSLAQRQARSTSNRPGAERRRRERHFRRRRRDLLEDAGFALLLAIVLISVTSGLGMLALLEIPIAGALLASVVAERKIARRSAASSRERHRAR